MGQVSVPAKAHMQAAQPGHWEGVSVMSVLLTLTLQCQHHLHHFKLPVFALM